MSQRWHRLRHPQRGLETPAWYTVKKCVSRFQSLKNTPLLPLDPLDQFTESWSDWEFPTHFMGPMKAWYVLLCDNFTGATIWWARKPAAPSVVFFATDGFPIPFFWGSRLVTLWECHPATENRQHLLVIKYVYQLPCDLGLGNPPFLFVFWCRMGVLVASRTGTRATLILQAWHGVRVGVWVLGWALKLEWSACHASRHSVERLAFPGVADMPSI
jgi:hypothetical protein